MSFARFASAPNSTLDLWKNVLSLVSFQYLAVLSAASVSLSVGLCVAHSGILIPQLQSDPEMKITLKQGSWMGRKSLNNSRYTE